MHENGNESGVATICERADQPSLHRPAQRPASWRPLVAGGSLHGARLAYPDEPPTCQGRHPGGSEADVEGFRPSRRRHSGRQETPRQQERLGTVGYESNDCRQPVYPQSQAAMVEGVAAPQGPVSVVNVMRLVEHQRYRCALTGRRLTPQTAALDHIVPIRCGGEHTIENAQVLHKDVNRAKASLTSEEFIGMCREVVRWSETSSTHMEVQP